MYLQYIIKNLTSLPYSSKKFIGFLHTVSYDRFVERLAQVGLHLLLFLQTCALGKCLQLDA